MISDLFERVMGRGFRLSDGKGWDFREESLVD